MKEKNKKVIFHIDVNSAFLSWSAVEALNKGEAVDIRELPCVIGGDEKSRRGVVLAKSNSAKAYGVVTGESLFSARRKCPNLKVVAPDFSVYERCSRAMMKLLKEYTPCFEQYSIDECFLDVTRDLIDEPVEMAHIIKDRIYKEFNFTVNVGVSCNKVLAKMASELKKPNMVNTLYPCEISEKLWPLPVDDLFMVGRSTKIKLNSLYIYTIGDLANYNVDILETKLKSYGKLIYEYANGIDESPVCSEDSDMKGISSSTTLAEDLESRKQAHEILFSLGEELSQRLRNIKKYCSSISVTIKNSDFKSYSHQKKLLNPTDSTKKILETIEELFDEMWKNEAIRLLGVSLTNLSEEANHQISIFDAPGNIKEKALDKAMDSIRNKYGKNAVKWAGKLK